MKPYLLPLALLIISFVCRILSDPDPDITDRLAEEGVEGTALVEMKEKTDKAYLLHLTFRAQDREVPYVKKQEVSESVWEATLPQTEVKIRYAKSNPEVLRVAGDRRGMGWRIAFWVLLAAGIAAFVRALMITLKRRAAGKAPAGANSRGA